MLNKQLATSLGQAQGGGMKTFYWAIELYKEGKLTLDKVDVDLLKKSIQEMQVSNLVKGRMIEIIEEAEKAEKSHLSVAE